MRQGARVVHRGTGERGMLYSAIMNDKNRPPAAEASGAVMGSKNLKAIAVRGTGSVRVARPEGFLREMSKARSIVQAHPVTGSGLAAYGTEILVNIINEVGGLPLHNARDGSVFARADETSGEKPRTPIS